MTALSYAPTPPVLSLVPPATGIVGTPQQEAFWQEILTGKTHIVLSARAGSGKSFSIVHGARLALDKWPNLRIGFCAFNKAIADELKKEIPAKAEADTMHGLGFRALTEHLGKKPDLQSDKTRILLHEMLRADELDARKRVPRTLGKAVSELVSKCKNYLLEGTPADIDFICKRHDVELEPNRAAKQGKGFLSEAERQADIKFKARVIELVPRVLERSKEMLSTIDFDDMIWLPVALELPVPQFHILFVDELQDTNKARQKLAFMMLHQHGRLVGVGDPCQPEGTLVTVARKRPRGRHQAQHEQVPIEQLKVGDRVVSYDAASCAFVQGGRAIVGITKRPYKGRTITVGLGSGHTSTYTPNHICIANFSPLRGKYAVYLMSQGDRFRIGKAKMDYNGSSSIGSGPITRARAEGADALWILAVYDTNAEACVMEQAIAGKFGLSQLTFKPVSGIGQVHLTDQTLEAAWKFIGRTAIRAQECLKHFGRDINYPLWEKGLRVCASLKRPMEVRACNLIDGVLMLPYRGTTHIKKSQWLPALILEDEYDGFVYSLDVEKEKLYIADGIVTHNCQAIYGFTGADTRSMENVKAQMDTTTRGSIELPLTWTRRCPKAVVKLAQELVPDLEAMPEAPEGVVEHVAAKDAATLMQPTHMVLCRCNAPLVGMAHQLLRAGKKALLKGKDLSKPILELMDTLGTQDVKEMGELLKRFRAVEVERLTDANKSAQVITAFEDKCETLEVLMEGCSTRAQIEAKIKRIFEEKDPEGAIILTSVHSSKGLEADTIWLLKPDLMPHPAALKKGRADDIEQEQNLKYVALTRTKNRLVFIDGHDVVKEAKAIIEAKKEEAPVPDMGIPTSEEAAPPVGNWDAIKGYLQSACDAAPYDAPLEFYAAIETALGAIPRGT